MTLQEYLDNGGKLTRGELAKAVGVSAPYITMLYTGVRTPSLEIAFRIERATKGKVKAITWAGAV